MASNKNKRVRSVQWIPSDTLGGTFRITAMLPLSRSPVQLLAHTVIRDIFAYVGFDVRLFYVCRAFAPAIRYTDPATGPVNRLLVHDNTLWMQWLSKEILNQQLYDVQFLKKCIRERGGGVRAIDWVKYGKRHIRRLQHQREWEPYAVMPRSAFAKEWYEYTTNESAAAELVQDALSDRCIRGQTKRLIDEERKKDRPIPFSIAATSRFVAMDGRPIPDDCEWLTDFTFAASRAINKQFKEVHGGTDEDTAQDRHCKQLRGVFVQWAYGNPDSRRRFWAIDSDCRDTDGCSCRNVEGCYDPLPDFAYDLADDIDDRVVVRVPY